MVTSKWYVWLNKISIFGFEFRMKFVPLSVKGLPLVLILLNSELLLQFRIHFQDLIEFERINFF